LAKTLYTERHRKLRELLIERRNAAGLTQTVLAERLGKPPSYVAKYELGEGDWMFGNTSILPPRSVSIRVS
jgi:transcriptional regulator with XRE-family HTH domain